MNTTNKILSGKVIEDIENLYDVVSATLDKHINNNDVIMTYLLSIDDLNQYNGEFNA